MKIPNDLLLKTNMEIKRIQQKNSTEIDQDTGFRANVALTSPQKPSNINNFKKKFSISKISNA